MSLASVVELVEPCRGFCLPCRGFESSRAEGFEGGAVPRFPLAVPRFPLAVPRFPLAVPRFVLAVPRFVLAVPRFCTFRPP